MRVLVVGYGNPSRRDDGAALVVINGLRQRLGLPPLDDDNGYTDLGRSVDTLFLHQLVPELAETLADYERVIFIDAHVGVIPEMIQRLVVIPTPDSSMVSHHIKPAALLELTQRLYGRAPQAELLSIRGFDFSFGTGLSPSTAQAVDKVVDEIWHELASS